MTTGDPLSGHRSLRSGDLNGALPCGVPDRLLARFDGVTPVEGIFSVMTPVNKLREVPDCISGSLVGAVLRNR
jgi:hypothetical protein